ncbi:DUF3011 domain-containing protein [Marilutibacter maris]|uniref:DUF3011 domain-containing protein n=1 Tax=Marilutibacter maris TaxID=1605891 RepID=A0A2U9T3U1_9GAMM|nr:DUF3011 domain-containing protein [Lysobacter maris]AWV07151.1 hypothetical protein C9I47_1450 [Lysobacter maris]KAB8194986.1 DUF3011 domain-containing protein [Lysobacter maris]
MGALIRMLAPVLVLACAGCIYDPGFFGGGPTAPGTPYPGGGHPGYPTYPNYPDPYPDNGRGGPFVCESRDNRTQRCPADTRGGVRLVRKLSRASCVEGQSWGVDRNGVWVTRGCRAEFVAGYGGTPPGYGTGLVRCESQDNRTRHCPADTRGGVRLSRKLSRASCVEGHSWGYDRGSIWVSRGCRAEFVTGRGGGHRPTPDPGHGRIVRCESRDGRHQRCSVHVPRGVVLSRQLSRAPCIRDSSWGWDRNGIWVGSGCRAEFSVR